MFTLNLVTNTERIPVLLHLFLFYGLQGSIAREDVGN